MAKGDYKDSARKTRYKNLVGKNTDTKVTVAQDEKRARAELLDMIEELFQTTGSGSITAEKLRAFCHILVKSVNNNTDDSLVLDSSTIASLPKSDPQSTGKLWNNKGVIAISK